MRAFKNTLQNKTEAVKEAKKHRKLDMLIHGTYSQGSGKNFKGCSVGCTYRPFQKGSESLHALSEPVHGIPKQLTYLRDRIFERLEPQDAKDWHVNFTVAINVNADLSGVIDKWMLFIVEDVQKFAKGNTLDAIKAVANLFKRKISGNSPTIKEWQSARCAAAYAAAADAAAAAAAAAYAAAAAADADAAAYAAAAYAAAAAAYAAAAYAARKKSFKGMVGKLLEIIKETK